MWHEQKLFSRRRHYITMVVCNTKQPSSDVCNDVTSATNRRYYQRINIGISYLLHMFNSWLIVNINDEPQMIMWRGGMLKVFSVYLGFELHNYKTCTSFPLEKSYGPKNSLNHSGFYKCGSFSKLFTSRNPLWSSFITQIATSKPWSAFARYTLA